MDPSKRSKQHSLFVAHVPGDGLCVFHSMVALVPGFNYLSLLAHIRSGAGSDAKMAAMKETFLYPLIKAYIRHLRFKKISDKEICYDLQALEDLIDRSQPLEKGGILFEHIGLIADFLGIDRPLEILSAEQWGKASKSGRPLASGKKGKRIIPLTGVFTTYGEGRAAGHAQPCFSYPPQISAIGKSLDFFITSPKVFNLPQTVGSALTEVLDDQSNDKLKLAKAKEKAADYKKQAEQEIKALKDLVVNPPSQNETSENKEGKAAEDARPSAIVLNPKTGGFTFHYSHDFKMGPRFQEIFERKNIRTFREAHGYGHPGLRATADYHNMLLLTEAFNERKTIVLEHAAKFHKTTAWMKTLPSETSLTYQWTRPETSVVGALDSLYLRAKGHLRYMSRHTCQHLTGDQLESIGKLRPEYARKALLAKVDGWNFADLTLSGEIGKYIEEDEVAHVAHDVLYYESAVEQFLRLPPRSKFYFSVMNYPSREGRYQYYDQEGYFEIKDKMVRSLPRDNGSGYRHPYVNWPSHSFTLRSPRRDGGFINVTVLETSKTGNFSSHTAYLAEWSRSPSHPLLTLSSDTTKDYVATLSTNGETVIRKIAGGLPEYHSTSDRLTADRRRVPFDEAIQEFLRPRLEYRGTDRKLDSRQALHIYKSLTEERKIYEPELHDLPYVVDQILLFYKDSAVTLRSLQASLVHPEYISDLSNLNATTEPYGWLPLALRVLALFILALLVRYSGTVLRSIGLSFLSEYYPTMFGFLLLLVWTSLIAAFLLWEAGYLGTLHLPGWTIRGIFSDREGTPTTGRARLGANSGFSDQERFSQVESIHLDTGKTNRFYHWAGNNYLRLDSSKAQSECTCKPVYAEVRPSGPVLHFGRCPLNTRAALLARQFNTISRPSPAGLGVFDRVVEDWFVRNKESLLRTLRFLPDEDLTFEKFIKDSEASKRPIYLKGWEKFLDKGRISTHMEVFSKLDEVHHAKLESSRPRCIFSPSPEIKAVGGYLARIMIKMVKSVEPGFISGFSEAGLAAHVSACLERENISPETRSIYTYDGSSHDAHQAPELIEMVDHRFMRELLPEILSRSDVPAYLHQVVLKALTQMEVPFRSRCGLKGRVRGTVFSGHPTRTTLFNTLRTILYNRYLMALIRPGERLLVCASGDDVLVFHSSGAPLALAEVEDAKALLGNPWGVGGLGQVAKDFIAGPLEKQSFLSKKLYAIAGEVAVYRLNSKLRVSGAVAALDNPLSPAQFAWGQSMCMKGISAAQEEIRQFWDKLASLATRKVEAKRIEKVFKREYQHRDRWDSTVQDPAFDPQVLIYDEQCHRFSDY